MSALTGEWSVEKIRAVMVHLDRKTGLHGAELPIEMGKAVSYLGRYYCGGAEILLLFHTPSE